MKLDRALLLLLLVAFLVRVPFLFIVPMVEAPDEYAHFWVTRFLFEHFAAPDAAQVSAGGPSAVYGSLPPFGYLPHVLCAHLLPWFDISFSERIGSILGGLITVFAAFRIGALIFASDPLLRLALPLCVAIHPQLVFVNAYCNSDSTACALASLLLALGLTMIYRGPRLRYAAISGVLCAMIALSKFSALAVVPVVFFALLGAGWIFQLTAFQIVMRLALTAGAACLLSVPWWARNAAVFAGDWLGTGTMRQTWAKTFSRSLEPVSLFSVLKQKVWWQQIFSSYWAVFGYQKHYLPAPFYFAYLVSIVISSAGAGLRLSQTLKKSRAPIIFFRRSLTARGEQSIADTAYEKTLQQQAAWLSLIFSIFFSGAGVLYAAVNNLGGPQGRYLFPSEIAFLAVILFGLRALGEKWGKWLVFTFIFLNALTLSYSMVMLYSMFGVKLKPY